MLITEFDEKAWEEAVREDGREEGREQGVNQEQRDRITVMLRKGKTPEDIADFCDYPIKLIRDVQKSMLVTE